MIVKWIMDNTRLVVGIGLVVLLIMLILTVSQCGKDEKAQARQDTKSADAYADAAKTAVETVTANASQAASVDELVNKATKEINDAENPVAARAAVIASLCGLRSYRDRPECKVQPANPK